MGFVKTTQDIYDWYMSNPNADASLVQAFRSAMTVSSTRQIQSTSQNKSQSLNIRSLDSVDDDDSKESSKTKSSKVSGGYVAPLGVSEDDGASDEAATLNATEIAVAAAAVATATGVAYALIKFEDDKD